MMDEAEKVYHDLLKLEGTKPNAATFRTLVFHLCKKGRYITAYKVFKQSVKVRKIPDFNTLKYLLEGLVKKGHMTEAKAMIRTMNEKFHPDLLKAWTKLSEDLGLAHVGKEEVDSGEVEKGAGESETEKAST
ncbi:hypothetical protein CDL12_03141 [Handroanthus impetiginosus]|uniref:Pentacotripeptide-repeat region of PRORP domain-containing protein n=1 Tax=Handroanthus impetiginosus TaxID=429701 RepID=A0A2G9I308_9LAMI|nr:hypothetical protein CDL12_03141 [Handroanthus impetiginosus]